MASELIIQLQDVYGNFSCEKFDNFPSPKSAYIAIAFNDSPRSAAYANQLKNELASALRNLGCYSGNSLPPCGGRGTAFLSCQALSIPDNTKLLIVVSDGSNSRFVHQNIVHWSKTVLPVIRSGSSVLLPPPLNQANAIFWSNGINEVIPTIFGLTGISESDQRIFISYRRTDASEFAEQLFDRLNHDGFEVFLDRFSINPGVNFQNRLYQELSDKAMVLLLETQNYQQSQWVQYEIDFAKKYRLGVLALNIDGAPEVSTVDDEYRMAVALNTSGTLDAIALNALVSKIAQHHSLALYRKRNYLATNILAALQNQGAAPDMDINGFITVEDFPRKKLYKIWAVPRPPVPGDYHYTDIANSSGEKFIVGPEFIEQKRDTINTWLSQKAVIQYFNEGKILDLASYIYP